MADIERRKPDPLYPEWIESDPYLALDAADTLYAAYALNTLQRPDDHILDEVRQLLGCFAGSNRGVGEDRKADHVDAPNQRCVNPLREIGANARNGVRYVGNRLIGFDPQSKLDGGNRNPVRDRRQNVTRASDTSDRILDLLGDLRFKFCRRGTELGDCNVDDGNVYVG